ncbi:MAG TPA: helix-turn-helix transcriptional regulator [Actinomycetes bacterium]|jgi:transcriptional regulator with XRE-family HTH domain|nr:helix-turn-helix transcriptional regulator [Actinomycetes bacterium]
MQQGARRQLGSKLLELRRRAELSGADLARLLSTNQPRISRIETGRSVPSVDDVRAWAEATHATSEEVAELGDLVRRLATETTSWRILHRLGLTQRQREIAELEREATLICTFQPTMVPGLLQVADYARRVMAQGNPSSQTDLAGAVAQRIDRQTVLYDQTKRFEFIITEGALRWRPGPPELMAAQLDRLISVASLPNIALGVLMLDQEAPDAYLHPFVIFELDDDALVTVETLSAELQVNEPEEIAVYRRTLDRYRGAALWGEEAAHAIRALFR